MDKQAIEAKMECIAIMEAKTASVDTLIEKEIKLIKELAENINWYSGVKTLSYGLKDIEKHIQSLRRYEAIAQAYDMSYKSLRSELEDTLYSENELFFDSLDELDRDSAMDLFKKGYTKEQVEEILFTI